MNSPLKQTVENKTDKEEKSKGKQKLRFFVCEALSVPGAATATGPVSGTGMIDLYKICLTRSLSPFCSLSILLAGFGVYLRGNMCLWLHIHVCTEEVVSTSADASSKSSQLHKPKVRCLLFLPLGTCGSPPHPSVADTQQNASPPLVPFFSVHPPLPHAGRLSTCSGVRSASGWSLCWTPRCCRTPCQWSESWGGRELRL